MIPNIIHFCFGMKPDFGGRPFSYLHYLAIKSASEVNRPEKIFFHYHYEPRGLWWKKAKPFLTLNQIEAPQEIFGRPLKHYAHQSDVVRLDALIKHGGIYLDSDVICLKSFSPLLKHEFVMGIQPGRGLCNAVMLASPSSQFLKIWYDEYRWFRSEGKDEFWEEHSVILPARLAEEHPDLIHIEEQRSFFFPNYDSPEVLFRSSTGDFSEAYCLHMWESVWWKDYLELLSPSVLRLSKHNFARLTKAFTKFKLSDPLCSLGVANYLRLFKRSFKKKLLIS